MGHNLAASDQACNELLESLASTLCDDPLGESLDNTSYQENLAQDTDLLPTLLNLTKKKKLTGETSSPGKVASSVDYEALAQLDLKEGDLCPACKTGHMVLKKGEKMSFLGCSCYPTCKMRAFVSTSASVRTLKILTTPCPSCGEPMAVKKGRYGLFIGCSNYPDCSYTYKEHDNKESLTCPLCAKGTMERKRARSGRTFYGCNNYPKCTFLLPGEPVAQQCPECSFPMRFYKKVKAGTALVCANPLCASRKRRKYDLVSVI